MLRHHSGVVQANDNLKTSLEVCSLVDEARLLIALGIGLRCVHVALTVHHLIPFPINDRTASDTHLEHIRIIGHQADGHETAKAPTVNAQTCSVHIVEGAQEIHTSHLVLHLDLSQMTECGLLKVTATILATTVVKDEKQITTLCHVGFPTAAAPMPAGIHIVSMRTAIHINHRGIFLGRVKINGHHHAVIEVGAVIGSLDRAATILGYGIALPGIGSSEITILTIVTGVHDSDVTGHVGLLIAVDEPSPTVAQAASVPPSPTLVDAGHLARGDIHAVEILLDGIIGIGTDDDCLTLGIKAQQVHHHPVAAGELFALLTGRVQDIKMVVTVTFTPQEELVAIPRQESDGMLRLNIFGMRLMID